MRVSSPRAIAAGVIPGDRHHIPQRRRQAVVAAMSELISEDRS